MEPCAVIWLHGMGGTGAVEEEWKSCFQRRPAWEKPKNCTWIFPRAPSGPVTFHGGRSLPRWCDTWGDKDSEAWTDSPSDVAASIELVHDLVRKSELKPERIVLGGFSQGAAIALLATLTFPERLAGCAMIGGWLSYPIADRVCKTLVGSANASTPIFWGHGMRDRSIPACLLEENSRVLDVLRLQAIDQRRYQCGHWPNDSMLVDMFKWLQNALPSSTV